VQVRHSEGVAIHADPESCAGHCREAVREALTGARTGEVLSGESNAVRGADAVVAGRRQQVRVRSVRGPLPPRVVFRPSACTYISCAGTGISSSSPWQAVPGPHREGRRP
jgi:hypothetical protein